MATQENTKILAIAHDIDRYLEKHPNAADSLTGVVRWWLNRQRYDDATEDVRAALDYLESQQAIFKHINADGTTIYRSFSPKTTKRH